MRNIKIIISKDDKHFALIPFTLAGLSDFWAVSISPDFNGQLISKRLFGVLSFQSKIKHFLRISTLDSKKCSNQNIYHISSYSFRGNYSFLAFALCTVTFVVSVKNCRNTEIMSQTWKIFLFYRNKK